MGQFKTNTLPARESSSGQVYAGLNMILAGFIAWMGIVTAEVLYPNYTSRQEISDLGSSAPPNPVIHQPSSTIFNSTMLVTGLLVIIAAVLLYRAGTRGGFPIALGLFGFGAFGVGVFPGNVVPWHGLFALLTFFAGGITAVLSARVSRHPISVIGVVFGGISLAVLLSVFVSELFFGGATPLAPLGFGGIERWVVYPLIAWIIAFGGYLLGTTEFESSPAAE